MLSHIPSSDGDNVPYRLYNIGNHTPVALLDFIKLLEKYLGKEAQKEFLPMQMGDVKETYADVADLMADVGFCPATSLEVGLKKFVDWYQGFFAGNP